MKNVPYIECIGIHKTYFSKGHEIKALTNINISIDKGQFVIISGRSGAGKSTLLNLIGGLIKPTTGTIRIGSEIISEISNREISRLLCREIGIIFQSFNLLPEYTVYENIELSLAPSGMNAKSMSKLILPLTEKFGITDKLDLLPEELSVGQQQKVAVIRTLVKKPALILADEPAGSVDEETAREISNCIRLLNEEQNATVILATHGSIPENGFDKVITLKEGYVEKA